MTDPVFKLLGARLTQLREEQGFTVQQLADSVGCSRGNLYHVESGTNAPSMDLVVKLARALRVDEIDLLCFPQQHPRHAVLELLRRVPNSTRILAREHVAALVAGLPPPALFTDKPKPRRGRKRARD